MIILRYYRATNLAIDSFVSGFCLHFSGLDISPAPTLEHILPVPDILSFDLYKRECTI